jgi:hypothetical protein
MRKEGGRRIRGGGGGTEVIQIVNNILSDATRVEEWDLVLHYLDYIRKFFMKNEAII